MYFSTTTFSKYQFIGQPSVECGNEFIRFSVKTIKPFHGKLFIKGQHATSECVHIYTANDDVSNNAKKYFITILSQFYLANSIKLFPSQSLQDKFNGSRQLVSTISKDFSCPPCPVCQQVSKIRKQREIAEQTADLKIKLGSCNAEYEHQIKPRAVIVSLTVVVSFHENLLTKLDRAFRIQCTYMEGSKMIGTDLNVRSKVIIGAQFNFYSMPQATDLESTIKPPNCYYMVRNLEGKAITTARVGELVEHYWICQSSFTDVYAMLVKNCYAEASDSFKVLVIDENGCSLDPYILPNLKYASNLLSVAIQAPVFKFPDRSQMGFQCDIAICLRNQQNCSSIIPPNCVDSRRRRREVFNSSTQELVLRTPKINIIDLGDAIHAKSPAKQSSSEFLNSQNYCMTITEFACAISIATFVVTTAAAIIGASAISNTPRVHR
ncbi:unnamed protein product [Thelazia callipaeda]|uniref:ZP domain-containing protein n=1 Tax=Thelazia callipaeda TaxID=103827 RepID=A0A3P7KYK1_THECL|nr:unnamed protein product [Thelazia callipaeda]